MILIGSIENMLGNKGLSLSPNGNDGDAPLVFVDDDVEAIEEHHILIINMFLMKTVEM